MGYLINFNNNTCLFEYFMYFFIHKEYSVLINNKREKNREIEEYGLS